jgi:hypothetical protein
MCGLVGSEGPKAIYLVRMHDCAIKLGWAGIAAQSQDTKSSGIL